MLHYMIIFLILTIAVWSKSLDVCCVSLWFLSPWCQGVIHLSGVFSKLPHGLVSLSLAENGITPKGNAGCLGNMIIMNLCKLYYPTPQYNNWFSFQLTAQCVVRLNITHPCRVSTGHGKPWKSWNVRVSFSRPVKSWKFIVGMESHW